MNYHDRLIELLSIDNVGSMSDEEYKEVIMLLDAARERFVILLEG